MKRKETGLQRGKRPDKRKEKKDERKIEKERKIKGSDGKKKKELLKKEQI